MLGVLRPADVAVDVGAYKGGYTYWMRHAVDEAGTVVAVEPQPRQATYLRGCVAAFGWTNVHIEEVALSSHQGSKTLYVPGRGTSPGASLDAASLPAQSRGYPVRTDTLDAVLEARGVTAPVRLIKCDVEGHELAVFQGARRVLEEHRPFLLFECEARHLRGHSMRDVFAHLRGLGYGGRFFWKGALLGIEDFDVARHQVQGVRPYGNNFVFAPED
jgi:FkbM family methyltransferase